ncbi:matrin-3-like [Silurus meridionalis]|uniref:RRM domain-containing protein n=1 Tax=Silurus meridionalis TaxID=175797 RepID=A0A8T0BK94_SILME|nr:matrin-3-like [Silurus meridionalis]XP_046705571.1 matrin-3-like [Silurus meridionalis]XP_046705572.1 matrin-3-like [Silurus meridionalis]XP_046705573.1 matrin-3-like [Silurus meridionalis]KAF7707474.1 hypothetical protein HF521_018692 [Silurus meridionalis]
MSQKYPYTNAGDDFLSHQDMYADSYQRQSHTHQPSARSTSHEQKCSTASSSRPVDCPVHLPGMALSFLQSCGLEPSDLAHLAELPEHLITVETLPKLLLQVKERKLSSSSSSRPNTSQPLDDTSTYAWEESSHSKPIEYPIELPEQPVYPLPPEQVQSWQDRWGNPRQFNSLDTSTRSSRSKSRSVSDYSIPKDSDLYCNITESTESSSHSFVELGPRPLLSLRLDPPVTVPKRKEASDYNCKVPPVFPHVCSLCDLSIPSTKDWFLHVRGSEHAKRQLKLVKKYPKWDQTIESARRTKSTEVYKVPTRKEASDFNGTSPPVFPYLCVLCNVTVFSEKSWSGHIISGQHAKSQLDLMGKYPEWDGTVQSSRRNDGNTSTDLKDGASKESTKDMKMLQGKEPSSRVVSFTPLPVGDGITSELTAIAKRFGSVRKSLFLPNQGYVEMTCLADAKKLVEHYSAKQLKLKGKFIKVTFSCDYKTLRDAEGNDKTQSRSSYTHRRSSPCSRYQRDSTSPGRRPSSERTHSSPRRRHSSDRSQSSPDRKRSSERTQSGSNRKRSSERTQSSLKRKSSSERTQSSPKRKCSSVTKHSSERKHSSSERTHFSPKTSYSSSKSGHEKERKDSQKSKENPSTSTHSCHSSSSALNDLEKASIDTEEQRSMSNNYDESMDSDSDLEGLEVIADDGEELAHDIDDHENKTRDHVYLPSDPLDTTDICTDKQEKTGGDAEDLEASNGLIKGQDFEEHADQEYDHDFPTILANCVTLDEFTEENFSDSQESDEPKASSPNIQETSDKTTTSTNTVCDVKQNDDESDLPKEETEETSDKITTSTNTVCEMKQNNKESESPKEESPSKTTEELGASQNLDNAVSQPKEEQDTEGANDKENFGKVLEVRNLPSTENYTDSDFMNIIKRYGDVTHYVLFHSCKMGFVEMALASDAERVAADSKNRDIVLRGNILKITVTEKYCCLPERFTIESDEDDDEEEEIGKGEISKESSDKQRSNELNGNTKFSNESLDRDGPIGTEFVRPVVGYFCSLCNVIYATEEEAKDEHCRSPLHYQKVKEQKEKSGTVENKK